MSKAECDIGREKPPASPVRKTNPAFLKKDYPENEGMHSDGGHRLQ
jgi:hypothetical protein